MAKCSTVFGGYSKKKFYASLQGPATLLGRELNLMWTALSLNDFT